jgi:extracellular elastinolytic metalloproteinase
MRLLITIVTIIFSFFIGLLNAQNHLPDSLIIAISDKHKIPSDYIKDAVVSSNYSSRNGKIKSIWLRQRYQEIPVYNADLFIVLNDSNKIVHSSISFINSIELIAQIESTKLNSDDFVLNALKPFVQVVPKSILERISKSETKHELVLAGIKSHIIQELIWFKSEHSVVLAYAFRFTDKDGLLREIIVRKSNGELLDSKILTVECNSGHFSSSESCFSHLPEANQAEQQLAVDGSSYRVFPYPFESPLNGPRVLISNPADVNASPYGWHDTDGQNGADGTEISGNNVVAYDDQDDDDFPDGTVDGGFGLQFDFPYATAPNTNPLESRDAALTNLFYANNRLHDVLWYYGFDEESGNFQFSNYSGASGAFDAVEAQGFDGGGFNNANFGTPPDGESPRMQMYLWAFNSSNEYLSIQSPSSIAGQYLSAVSTFGEQTTPSPIIAPVVIVNDGSENPSLGCDFPLNDVQDKIVLIDRGICNFVDKVFNAELGGALAVIVVNNTNEGVFSMGGVNPNITIPSLLISITDGDVLKSAITTGQVEARVFIESSSPYFDSNFDNGVIAHEYGHGVSNRLTGGPLNTNCLQNEEQMGEGWSDYIALMMTLTSSNSADEARGIGNFLRGYSTNGPGIRPFPYSRDLSINPVTYNYITELSIPHGLGSVWCSMLWDMTWDLIDLYGYDSDIINGTGGNNIAFQLVMDGMRLQPCLPGFIDGRDAILLADQLNNNGANRCLIWRAFARRGLGYLADQGSSEDAFDGFQDFIVPPNCSQADFAFFSSSSPVACKGDAIVYTDLSDPPAISRNWTFEGGIPATSTDSIVSVVYNQSGLKEAILAVENGNGTDDYSSLVSITNPPSMNVVKGNAAPGNDNGFIYITPIGGTPPYTTEWTQFPGINDLTITSLAPGAYQLSLIDGAGCSVDTIINVDLINSIDDFSDFQLRVFPNPFGESVNVQVQNSSLIVSVVLYDVSGRIIINKTVNSSLTQINTEFISSGTYILQVLLKNGKLLQKRLVK